MTGEIGPLYWLGKIAIIAFYTAINLQRIVNCTPTIAEPFCKTKKPNLLVVATSCKSYEM